jgi:hypothetical protein
MPGLIKVKRQTYRVLLWSQWPTALDSPLLIFQVQSLLLERVFHLPVPGIELFFGLLELGLLLGDLLLEHHLHLCFHLGQLGLVESAVFGELNGRAEKATISIGS